MYFVTGKNIPRRTFIRGAGATLALPFLDAMLPAGQAHGASKEVGATRLVCIEEVHGLPGCNDWGADRPLISRDPQSIRRLFS